MLPNMFLAYIRLIFRGSEDEPFTGHTQKNGAVSIVFTIETAPLFCVCSV
jgi:hypothetical protein